MSNPGSTPDDASSGHTDGLTAAPRQVLKSIRDVADRVVAASQDLALAGARKAPGPLAGPLASYLELVTSLSDLLTGPMQDLLNEQQRLADQLAVWSQRNAELSEQLAGWADQHRRVTERMQGVVRPAVDQVRRVTDATRAVSGELRGED